jgi:NAD(P)-dependent dehydrogenase (short-subunit alcohol dehydrogenase family)
MPTDRPVMMVTGGSRGIGAAVVRLAAQRGHDVVINYASAVESANAVAHQARSFGVRALVVQADVGVESDMLDLFGAVDAEFGRLDVLVNNAGIAGGYGTIDCVDEAMLARLWAVNVTSAFVCAREASARMRVDRGGRGGSIVNISSKAAVLGGAGEWIHYAASKGAIDTLTVGLAKELAAFGVRVNGVRPGLVESDFHQHAPAGRMARIAPTVPMQRAGSPEEVATAVLWLAGPESSYVTGSFIDAAGGR